MRIKLNSNEYILAFGHQIHNPPIIRPATGHLAMATSYAAIWPTGDSDKKKVAECAS